MKRSRARSKKSIDFAKSQRQMSSDYVLTVWHWLRDRKISGQKFRREHPIPPYTADFFCVALGLVIEVDGQPHLTPQGMEHDRIKNRFLKSKGYAILRIPGYEILRDPDSVRNRIMDFVENALSNAKHPSALAPSSHTPLLPQQSPGAKGGQADALNSHGTELSKYSRESKHVQC